MHWMSRFLKAIRTLGPDAPQVQAMLADETADAGLRRLARTSADLARKFRTTDLIRENQRP